jgi:putative DNA primase/helicase
MQSVMDNANIFKGLDVTNSIKFLHLEGTELPADLQYLVTNNINRFLLYRLVCPYAADKDGNRPTPKQADKRVAREWFQGQPVEDAKEQWVSYEQALALKASNPGSQIAFCYANFCNVSIEGVMLPVELVPAIERKHYIFPVPKGTKSSHVKWIYGPTPASPDATQLRQWFAVFPRCDWGRRTGTISGMFVVDIDTAKGQEWIDSNGGLPETYTVKSGSPEPFKKHYYFKLPDAMVINGSSSEIAPGVDIRGENNMVVIPPSGHKSGGRYRVEKDVELALPPRFIIDAIRAIGDIEDSITPKKERPASADVNSERTAQDKDRAASYFDRKCQEHTQVPHGQRAKALFTLAACGGNMVAAGCFDEQYVEETIYRYMPEYADERQSVDRIASGIRKGLSDPWYPGQNDIGPEVFLKAAGSVPALPSVDGIELKGVESSLLQLKTQDSVAQIFELKQNGKLLFNHSRGTWMEWDGKRWKAEKTDKAFDFARSLSRSLNWEGKAAMGTASFCGGVEKFARASRTFAVEGDQFDRDHYLLNTPSGTIDLRTGKMRPHDPNDKITLCTAAAPDSGGDGSAFRKFMTEITAGDQELIRFHQVSLGACLSGAVEDHWMLFWTGTGRNGKNTLGELVEALLGDYARTIPTSTLMSKKFESHPTEMANLSGVRLATSSELSDGDHWNDSRIKQLTGDATLSARYIGGNFFEFDRSFKLLVYGNYKPQLRSADEALRARMKIVPFNVSFMGREDKDLPGRLRAEMGYVLQWLLEGHQQWLDAGKKLPKCSAVDAEISHYFEGQSTPKLWLKDCCQVLEREDRPNLQLHTVTECYRSYKQWKEARGESPLSQTRWQPEALQGLQTVETRKGVVVKKLRLLPMHNGELLFTQEPARFTAPLQ